MADTQCPWHADHENRIKTLEVDVKEIEKNQKSPAVVVALIGLFGTLVATIGSVIGAVVAAYLKVRGYI